MEAFPLISFFTGIISVLSPCILPILPIFVGVSLNSKTKLNLVSFVNGLLSIFIVIIFLTAFFTQILYAYIPYMRVISAVLLLSIGIMMFFDYSIDYKPIKSRGNYGLASYFAMGFLTSLAWVPCYSGYLISLIALLVSSNSAIYAALNIFIYSLGFALTLLVLSLLISEINLNKLISKTKNIPKIFAVLVIIGALYLLFNSIF